MRTAIGLLAGWLVAALLALGIDGRLPAFLAWVVPGSLLVLGVDALVRQQRAPSPYTQPSLPERYRVADDLRRPPPRRAGRLLAGRAGPSALEFPRLTTVVDADVRLPVRPAAHRHPMKEVCANPRIGNGGDAPGCRTTHSRPPACPGSCRRC